MNRIHFSLFCAVAAASPLAAQFPVSSTLARGETMVNDDFINVATHGWGTWCVASPREVLPAGPAGTVPTAQVAYVTYMDLDINGSGFDSLEFRRSTDGGYTWGAPQTIYVLSAGEAIDATETRLVTHGHEVFVVFASNIQSIGGGQAVWAMGSSDQGQTWSAPILLSTGVPATLYDVDEVNAACSGNTPSGPGLLNVVFESDYQSTGWEDIFFAQAALQNGQLVITVPELRLNHSVPAMTYDVDFTSIAADGPFVHICWTDDRFAPGNSHDDKEGQYFSMSSIQNGTDFTTVTEYQHTHYPTLTWAAPRRPRAAVDGTTGYCYTFMDRSLLGSATGWLPAPVVINQTVATVTDDVDDFYVTVDQGRIAVVYVDDRLGQGNNYNLAFVTVDFNAGDDFINGTNGEAALSQRDPNPIYGIDMVGDIIAVVYETNCASGEDFALSLSADAGATFNNYDVTSFGGCGMRPGGVDVDDPRMTLTRNGDCIAIWIDDRTPLATGGGNTVNNVYVTGIHYPELIDRTATGQGLRFQNDSPAHANDWALVLLSGSGTSTPWVQGNMGFSLNLTADFWLTASIGGAIGSPPGPNNLNLNFVGTSGAADFVLVPNPTALLGLPFWAAAVTIDTAHASFRSFTDPIMF